MDQGYFEQIETCNFTDPVIYFFGHSERVREKVQDEIPAVWDLRAWAKVSSIAPASPGTQRDLFSCSREGWTLTAGTDLETPRMTRKVPVP